MCQLLCSIVVSFIDLRARMACLSGVKDRATDRNAMAVREVGVEEQQARNGLLCVNILDVTD